MNAKRSLRLRKEVLTELADGELENVVAGTVTQVLSVCWTCTCLTCQIPRCQAPASMLVCTR